jgi:ribulose 1,5-bisphosphate carboxylase large subunit-like protein
VTDFTPARFIADNRRKEMAAEAVDGGMDFDDAFEYLKEHNYEGFKELIVNGYELREVIIHFLTEDQKFISYNSDWLEEIYDSYQEY